MPFTTALLKEAKAHLPTKGVNQLEDAHTLAQSLYGETKHFSGETLLLHVEQVTRLMLPLHPDMTMLIACLLQYVEIKEHLDQIEGQFGKDVIRIIQYTSILDRPDRIQPLSPTYLQKMILVLSEDIRVILICLHNRLHLLQEAVTLDPKLRVALSREVLEVFAPLATRLGVYSLKYELETLAFGHLHNEEAKYIETVMQSIRRAHGSFMPIAKRTIEKLLESEQIAAVVTTREKHPYSIFRKMERKGISNLTDIHDLFGIRIVVATEEDCYRTLGMIHKTYRPIMHRVKDYIAFCKPNGYRSLHTTVLGLNVKDPTMPIEVQIRTKEMDEEAEFGIAAHWNYEEGGKHVTHQAIWSERMKTLKNLSLAREADDESSGEVPHEKERFQDIIADRIFVLTPKGDPIELPKGATPLDFAFRIHTDIGLQFRGSRVNGVIAPIEQPLDNGDMVEILRQKTPNPSMQWLTILRTSEAKQKLRNYFRAHGQAIHTETEQQEPSKPKPKKTSSQKRGADAPDRKPPGVRLPVDANLPYRFARCCNPQIEASLHTPITGFATREGVITIHKEGCRMLDNANRDRFLKASWGEIVEN